MPKILDLLSLEGGAVITTSPVASAGTYEILTRNLSTGVLEKVLSTTYAPATGGTGYIQNQSASAQSSSNAWVSGFLQAGNLRLTNNTLSAQNTNGHVNVTSNGTGEVMLSINNIARVYVDLFGGLNITNGTQIIRAVSGNLKLSTGDNVNGNLVFDIAGTERWRVTTAGVLESNGAQTIRTSTGDLTLATLAGNGNILLSLNGTGRAEVFKGSLGEYLRVGGGTLSDRSLRFSNYTISGLSGVGHLISAPHADGEISFDTAGTTKWVIANTTGTLYSPAARSIITEGTMTLATNANGNVIITPNGTGNVGIGTTSPEYQLTLGNGGASTIHQIIKINAGSTGIAGTYYYQNNVVKGLFGLAGGTGHLISGSVLGDFNVRNSQRILFSANAGGSIQMSLDTTGQLGIGNITPTQRLDVDGNIRVRSLGTSAGSIVTTDANGVFSRRTASEIRSDISVSQYASTHSATWIPASSPGWYRIGFTNNDNRGGARFIISFRGGNFTPQSYVIDVDKSWVHSGGFIKVDARSISTQPITGFRIIQAVGDTSIHYLEAYFINTPNPYEFTLAFDNSFGYSTWNIATSPLTATTNGPVLVSLNVGTSGSYSTSNGFFAGSLGIGVDTTAYKIEALLSSGVTTSQTSVARLVHKSTGDMVDGFGTSLLFAIDDTANSIQNIARITASRAGADNTGQLNFDTYIAGVLGNRWSILSSGVFESVGAQTIRTSTGDLTLATAAGNGNILLTPHGTGALQYNAANGAGAGDFLTLDGSNYVRRRTAAQVLTDIGATPVTGGSGYIQNQNAGIQSFSNFIISGSGAASLFYTQGSGTESLDYKLNATTMGYNVAGAYGWITAGGAASRTSLILNAGGGKVGIRQTPQTSFEVGHSSGDYPHFGGTTTTNGTLYGLSFGYRENNLLYRKAAIIQEQIGDGAARGNVHLLVNVSNGANSVTLSDSRIKIDGLTGSISLTPVTHVIYAAPSGADTETSALLLNGSNHIVKRTLGTGAFATISDYLTVSAAASTYQPLDADLTAIAALGFTSSALLRKTAANTWTLDTNTYLTANQTITISGDASGSGTTAITLTLANSGVTAGTYRSVTVDAKGRVTAGTNPTTISGYSITDFYSQVISGFVTGANSTVLNTDTLEVAIEKLQGQINARLTANQTITLSGAVTGSGTTSIVTTIANDAVTTAKILNGNVTLAKIAPIATSRLLGRVTGSTGVVEELTAAQVRTLLNVANGATANTGTVTSVSMSVPTGLSISGSPITTSGTLALSFTAGYSLPTTAKQSNWDTAFGWGNHAGLYVPTARNLTIVGSTEGTQSLAADRIFTIDALVRTRNVNPLTDFNNAQVSGTLTVWDGNWLGPSVRTNFPIGGDNGDGYGVLVAASSVSTSNEGLMQMWFRNNATSSVYVRTGFDGTYNSWSRLWGSLDFSSTEISNWNTAYTNRITSLTTTGTFGAATLISNVLNIPNYTLSGLGGVSTALEITVSDPSGRLNVTGGTQNLSTNRQWIVSLNNVTSVGGGTTEEYALQLGHNRTGNGVSYIDLIGDAFYTDYGLRIIRSAGQNGSSLLYHRGTGDFIIDARDSANIAFYTQDVPRWTIKSSGVFESVGAQTITTSTGNLTIATGGGNGDLILSPNGTGHLIYAAPTGTGAETRALFRQGSTNKIVNRELGTMAFEAATAYTPLSIAGYSVFGKSTTGTGNGAAITAGTDSVLRRLGGDLDFGTIGSSHIDDLEFSKLTSLPEALTGHGVATVVANVGADIGIASGTTEVVLFDEILVDNQTRYNSSTGEFSIDSDEVWEFSLTVGLLTASGMIHVVVGLEDITNAKTLAFVEYETANRDGRTLNFVCSSLTPIAVALTVKSTNPVNITGESLSTFPIQTWVSAKRLK